MKKFLIGFLIFLRLESASADAKFDGCSCVGSETRTGFELNGYNIVKSSNGEATTQIVSLGYFQVAQSGIDIVSTAYDRCTASLYQLQQSEACPNPNAPKKKFLGIF